MSRLLHLLVLILGLCLLTPEPAAGQPQPSKAFAEGSHAFRAILKQKFQIIPLRSLEELDAVPANRTLIIVLGDTSPLIPLDRRKDRLVDFLKNGGALLVASDRPSQGPLLGNFHVRVNGKLYVYGPELQHRGYRQLSDCPFVERRAKHPIFVGVSQLATNRPSALEQTRPSLDPLAYTADDKLFAVGNDLGSGRILVLADHSVFINEMMLQDDNDNFQFAMNCVDWLTHEGRRDHVLLYEDGQIVTNFNVSFKPPPMPSDAEMVQMANRFVADLEDENFFNRALLNVVGGNDPNLGHDRLLRVVILVLSLALGIYGLYRIMQARHRADKHVPLLANSLALVPAEAAVDQRRREMVLDGNFWESARQLARQCFPEDAVIVATGPWWQRGGLRRTAERLRRLAHEEEPSRVSARKLRQIAGQARQVQAALADGRLRCVAKTSPPAHGPGRLAHA